MKHRICVAVFQTPLSWRLDEESPNSKATEMAITLGDSTAQVIQQDSN